MRLSVAMCTYNGEKYIREQLMSIRNQTLRIDEIVICDDCSEDDTVEIIENLIRQYDLPVRLHVNTWNHGYRKGYLPLFRRYYLFIGSGRHLVANESRNHYRLF